MKTGLKLQSNSFKDYNLATTLKTLIDIVDGRLTITDNIQGMVLRGFNFEKANFDYPIVHNLGRVVRDYLILGKTTFGNFKNGNQAPTQSRLYLQCDTANTIADILILG